MTSELIKSERWQARVDQHVGKSRYYSAAVQAGTSREGPVVGPPDVLYNYLIM